MRKRTVVNICKEIFWHIVYFLPVIIALFSFLLFTTENYAKYLIDGSSKSKIVDLSGTSWEFNESLTLFEDTSLGYYDVYDLNFVVPEHPDMNTAERYTSIIFASDYNAEGGCQILYGDSIGDKFIVFDNGYNASGWVKGDQYRYIDIVDGLDADNEKLIAMLESSAVLKTNLDTNDINSVGALFADGFNSAFDVMGMNFEKDYLYGALNQVFVNGGMLAAFKEVSILLKFATYYFYVHIIHLFIDALLFIPKIAHKWIDSLTRCE